MKPKTFRRKHLRGGKTPKRGGPASGTRSRSKRSAKEVFIEEKFDGLKREFDTEEKDFIKQALGIIYDNNSAVEARGGFFKDLWKWRIPNAAQFVEIMQYRSDLKQKGSNTHGVHEGGEWVMLAPPYPPVPPNVYELNYNKNHRFKYVVHTGTSGH